MDPSFRWDDDDVVRRYRSARTLRAWIPAFAGMTNKSNSKWILPPCDGRTLCLYFVGDR